MAEIELIFDSIRVSLKNHQRVAVLKEKDTNRYLPIWIGASEADAIAVKIQGTSVPRPLTHDFALSIVDALRGKVMGVVINELQKDCYFAKTRLESEGKIIEIDCRPSDAIALAVRVQVPIYAEEDVLNRGGVWLDKGTENAVVENTANSEEVVSKKPKQLDVGNFKIFSVSVREIFLRAEEQAEQANNKYIGTGHLLLALIEKAPNTASNILTRAGVNLTELITAVKFSIDKEQPFDLNKTGLNDNTKRVIQLAIEEAKSLDSQQVLPEHLLIGMLREDSGEAGKILRAQSIEPDKIYLELIRFYYQTRAK